VSIAIEMSMNKCRTNFFTVEFTVYFPALFLFLARKGGITPIPLIYLFCDVVQHVMTPFISLRVSTVCLCACVFDSR